MSIAPRPRASARRSTTAVAAVALVASATAILVLVARPSPVRGQAADDDPSAISPPDARRVTLDEAVTLALRRNPSLAAVRGDLEVAEADRMGAWGGFLPTVELGYGHARSSTGRLDPTGQSITNTSWTAQLTGTYDLFSGFRRMADVSAAGDRVEAAEARLEEARYRTVVEVKSAFFGAVARRELASVEADRVRRQEAQLDSVRVQLEMGRASRPDLLRSEVGLNQARLAQIRAENAARTANFRLARALGMQEPVAPVESAELGLVRVTLAREEIEAAAQEAGPSVARARAEAEAAEAEVGVARSEYFPEFAVSAGYAWTSEDFPPERRSSQVYVYGSLPLFDGLGRESRMDRAGARAEQARAEVRRAELELRTAVDSAFSVIEASRAAVEVASRTVELSGQELEMQREMFGLGRGSVLELQQAQISLRQAEADRVQSLFDHHMAIAQLEYLIGRSVTEREPLARRPGFRPAGPTASIP